MSNKTEIKITPAKGRPMLSWVGKRAITRLPVYPAQHIETYSANGAKSGGNWREWPEPYPQGGGAIPWRQ